MRALVIVATAASAVLVLGSFAGALHPLGDSLAVFRVPLLVAFALLVIWAPWPRRLRWPLAGLALALMTPHALAPFRAAEIGQADLTLYQQNMLFNRPDGDAWLAEVARRAPDLLTLQEVSPANLALLERLRADYPHQHHCRFGRFMGQAVLSRAPFLPGSAACSAPEGATSVKIEVDGRVIRVISLHLHWPWPHRQAAQLAGLLPGLGGFDGPVLLAGDFNAVAWSHSLAQVERATGAGLIGPDAATFHIPPPGWPVGIDHVLWSGRGEVTVLPKLGSDHHGLWARLVWPE